MSDNNILVVEDEPTLRGFICDALRRRNYTVDTAGDGLAALRKIEKKHYPLIISDIRLPKASGIRILETVRDNGINSHVILMTAYGTVRDAVEAMRKGASDYLTKPFTVKDMEVVLKRTLGSPSGGDGKHTQDAGHWSDVVVGQSPAMCEVFELADKLAAGTANVLIHGKTGTGKEIVARAIHQISPRAHKPFVTLNCAAMPDGLVESELFGHEKGAFTGALQQTKGRFEKANGGTLLLDEISATSPSFQVKLLRVLQEREFERVGNGPTLQVDVRIIATTNTDLKKLVEEGKFREDLFYRLNVVPVYLPPLRQRKEDIPLFCDHFLKKYGGTNGHCAKTISEDVLQMLMQHDWPGNVRELENCIERAIIMCMGNAITPQDLMFETAAVDRVVDVSDQFLGMTIREAERNLIMKTLKTTANNRTKAAQNLGISVRTLRNKLKEYRNEGLL